MAAITISAHELHEAWRLLSPATLVDVTGLIIYSTVASLILRGTVL